MPSGLYGFRPKERPQYQSTDAVTNPIDPRVPRVPGQPPVPTTTTSSSNEPYHSGVSAENDDDGGQADTTGGASYASPQEAFSYNQAALSHGYFGTVQDAAKQGRTDVLSDYLNNPLTTGKVQTPGLLGFAANQTGLTPSHDFTNLDIAQSAINAGHAADIGIGVGAFGGLGPTVANTGIGLSDFSPADNSEDVYSASPAEVSQAAVESQVGLDAFGGASHGVENHGNSDDGGHTDGTQSGQETSHSGGYGGFSDDTASSGGGGGGGK